MNPSSRREQMALARPAEPDASTYKKSTDVLSDVLRVMRITGALLFHAEFSAPFCVSAPPAHQGMARLLAPGAKRFIRFHIVEEGECWAERDGSPPLNLAAGDVIVLPYGDAHAVADAPGRDPVPLAALLPPLPWPRLPTVRHGGAGPVTRILCGFLHADDVPYHPLLAGLPPMLRVRAQHSQPVPRLETIIGYTLEESRHDRPGGECMLSRLVEVLFVEVLRRHIEKLSDEEIRPLGALRDPLVCRALELLHARPQRPWSLNDLARQAGASRSVLAERFKDLVGMSPMQYLTGWRLQLAARCLCRPQANLSKVAVQAGYESEAAFNRAFKRYLGEPPATWRRKQLAA
jgi:AraC family transcriptional regulator, alkane utilization regulator